MARMQVRQDRLEPQQIFFTKPAANIHVLRHEAYAMGDCRIASHQNKFHTTSRQRRQHARLFMAPNGRVLKHLAEAESFVVILKSLPRRSGESALDKGQVDTLCDCAPPRRSSAGRADVPGT